MLSEAMTLSFHFAFTFATIFIKIHPQASGGRRSRIDGKTIQASFFKVCNLDVIFFANNCCMKLNLRKAGRRVTKRGRHLLPLTRQTDFLVSLITKPILHCFLPNSIVKIVMYDTKVWFQNFITITICCM